MSEEDICAALISRKRHGYRGGMPQDAQISAVEAFRRWLAGEREYVHARGRLEGDVEETISSDLDGSRSTAADSEAGAVRAEGYAAAESEVSCTPA
eukprot:1667692-Prymnesium_polylepis.1